MNFLFRKDLPSLRTYSLRDIGRRKNATESVGAGCLGSEVTIQCSRDPNATIAIENATFYHIPYLAINCSRGRLGPVAVAWEPGFAQRLVQRTFFPTVSRGVTGCCTQKFTEMNPISLQTFSLPTHSVRDLRQALNRRCSGLSRGVG